jgi:hypothetical protein
VPKSKECIQSYYARLFSFKGSNFHFPPSNSSSNRFMSTFPEISCTRVQNKTFNLCFSYHKHVLLHSSVNLSSIWTVKKCFTRISLVLPDTNYNLPFYLAFQTWLNNFTISFARVPLASTSIGHNPPLTLASHNTEQ